MTELENVSCETQVLICTNDRPGEKPCCSRYGGVEFFQKFKAKMKESGKAGTHWVTKTGCLGYCNSIGTTVAIYKKGAPTRWKSEVTMNDFDTLWKEVT